MHILSKSSLISLAFPVPGLSFLKLILAVSPYFSFEENVQKTQNKIVNYLLGDKGLRAAQFSSGK